MSCAALLAVSFLPVTQALAVSSAPVPHGFVLLCEDHPAECTGGGAAQVHYSAALAAKLKSVNAAVNSAITPDTNDPFDVWQINVTRGDCEEYALAKRDRLRKLGVDASALRIVYALRNGGGHAILAVMTDQGALVLDNMRSDIRPLNKTGYRIVSMMSANPKVWQRA
jgi:predicted transglutaminase-like cysteine proteinase